MSKKPQVQQQSNRVAAASASLCFKDNKPSGIILSTQERIKDNDEVDVIDGEIMFVGFDSLDEQFKNDAMVRYVSSKHPKFEKILAAARAKGIVTNEA
jgi:hypothetical protein